MRDTPAHLAYARRIAQLCVNKRYFARVPRHRPHNPLLSPFRSLGRHRRARQARELDATFEAKHVYDFNHAAVSRLHVVVLVQSAHNLLARDRSGTSDPMVCVSLAGGEQSHSTAVISKNCYPVWNEVFTFGVKDVAAQQLVFRVFDYDRGREDDFLGYVALPLHNVPTEAELRERTRRLRLAQQRYRESLENVDSQDFVRSEFSYSGHLEDRGSPTLSSSQQHLLRRGRSPSKTLNATASRQSFRAEAVTATFRQSGGMLDDVKALFKGERAFDGAMRELQLGYGGEHRRLGVKGTIRVGAFLREYNPSELHKRTGSGGGDEDEDDEDGAASLASKSADALDAQDLQKYQLYCHVLHGKGIREVAKRSLKVGNYVPGLQWMNRVGMKVDDTAVFTNYALKTSGPIWRELISMEVSHISQRAVRLRMYQCSSLEASSLASNTLNRFVGEVSIPLSLVKIISPHSEAPQTGEEETGAANSLPQSPYAQYHASTVPQRTRHRVDPSLHAAAAEDDLLSSVDLRDIPEPSMMPLVFSWEEKKGHHQGSKYKRHNGELMCSIWMVPKGGSLFGEATEDDVVDATAIGADPLAVPKPLENVVIDAVVPMPVAFLRRELWGRQDSPSMLAHFEEKDFKNIKVGKWEHKGGEDGRSDAALTRDISYLLPGSFGIAAMMVYENQMIEPSQDVGGGFVVQCSAQAPDVSYGKSITTLNQFVFEWVAPRQTRVRVSCQVNFGKGAPPGFICSQIRNGSKKGAKESSELLIDMLSSSGAGATKRKKRKARKTGILARWMPQIVAIMVLVAALVAAWLLRK